jgi:prolyl oligopeptidase
MSRLASACLMAGLISAAAAGTAMAAETPADPYAWLEDVAGEKSLDWVKQQNATSEGRLAQTPAFKQMEASILEVLDSDAKIPGVQKIGDYLYNFWRDARARARPVAPHHAGAYQGKDTAWETVIDLDQLARDEHENWVWAGAHCLRPKGERCLVSLSRGGSDAHVIREYDLASRSFPIKDGFMLPEAKGGRLDRPRHRVRLHRLRPRLDEQLRLPAHGQGMEARHAAGQRPAWCTKRRPPT